MKVVDNVHVNSHAELIKHVEVGDEVLVITKQGVTHEFTVKAIDSKKISGEKVEVSIADIDKINKKEFSLLKTGWLVLGVISIVVMSCCFIVS
ncbi:hypothetical protein GCM10007894_03540 [Paraferrimonas haliotis]|uniref:Uncharacterized protein n=2 Tax=Paraferrimonas haliotis TaxID=2013866 RepID=A0AA37TQ77_9GAMM|nr:hypothetical protein GCM10007894_03540 [Paraferrimonas haliotis]